MRTHLLKNTEEGSTMVEAAIVLPVLFLIIALIISVSVRTYCRVGDRGAECEEETSDWISSDPMPEERILRLRWMRTGWQQ